MNLNPHRAEKRRQAGAHSKRFAPDLPSVDEFAPAFGVRRLVAAFCAGDLSPGVLRGKVRSRAFDGDKSPRESGDESPHSKRFAPDLPGVNEFAPAFGVRRLVA